MTGICRQSSGTCWNLHPLDHLLLAPQMIKLSPQLSAAMNTRPLPSVDRRGRGRRRVPTRGQPRSGPRRSLCVQHLFNATGPSRSVTHSSEHVFAFCDRSDSRVAAYFYHAEVLRELPPRDSGCPYASVHCCVINVTAGPACAYLAGNGGDLPAGHLPDVSKLIRIAECDHLGTDT